MPDADLRFGTSLLGPISTATDSAPSTRISPRSLARDAIDGDHARTYALELLDDESVTVARSQGG